MRCTASSKRSTDAASVSFGSYFWMLRGNRVQAPAGRTILEAPEAGKIVLPEHDDVTPRAWCARPYGF